jgi:hypothetical protein
MSVLMQVSRKTRCRAHPGLGTQPLRSYSHLRRVDVTEAGRPVSWDARNARMHGPSVCARRRDLSPMIVHLLMVATAMCMFWDLYLLAVHASG